MRRRKGENRRKMKMREMEMGKLGQDRIKGLKKKKKQSLRNWEEEQREGLDSEEYSVSDEIEKTTSFSAAHRHRDRLLIWQKSKLPSIRDPTHLQPILFYFIFFSCVSSFSKLNIQTIYKI